MSRVLQPVSPRNPQKSECTTQVKVNCGCTARFTSIEEAEQHALEFNHILHITGTVQPPARFA